MRLSIKLEKLSVLCESSGETCFVGKLSGFHPQAIQRLSQTAKPIQYTEIKTKFLVIHRIVPDIVYKGI
jgi:hypothetical protein